MNTRNSILLALLLGGAALTLLATGATRPRGDEDEKPAKGEAAHKHVDEAKHDEHGKDKGETKEEAKDEGHEAKELKFDAAARKKLGIELAEMEEATLQPEVTAIGTLEDDPAETFTVRSPIAGYLRATDAQ